MANAGRLPRGHRPLWCSRDEAAQTFCSLGPACEDNACALDHGDSMVMMTAWKAKQLADAVPAACPECGVNLKHTRVWHGFAGNAALLPTCPGCTRAGEWQQLQEEVEVKVAGGSTAGATAASVVLDSGATTPSTSTTRAWASERPAKLMRAQHTSKPILQALSACDVAGAKWSLFTKVCAAWGWKFPRHARAQHAHMGAAWALADHYTVALLNESTFWPAVKSHVSTHVMHTGLLRSRPPKSLPLSLRVHLLQPLQRFLIISNPPRLTPHEQF